MCPVNCIATRSGMPARSRLRTPFSTVGIGSTPDGADFTIDGKFVGNTPSTVRLPPGHHTVLVEKPGVKPWQRVITVSSNGTVKLDAQLEKTIASGR